MSDFDSILGPGRGASDGGQAPKPEPFLVRAQLLAATVSLLGAREAVVR